MTRALDKLRRTYETGEPLYRLSNAVSARTILTDTIAGIDEKLAREREAFAAQLSFWTGTTSEPQRPFDVSEQARKARYAAAVGWTLFAAEVALTILLSVSFDVNPVVAVVLAVALPLGIGIGAALLCECRPNPLETERRIQRRVLLPGLIVLLSSAIVLTAARTFVGVLAAELSRYVSISLWTLSLGLAVTSAAVLALANLWSWSSAAVRRYARSETAASGYRAELARVTVIESKLSSATAAMLACVLMSALLLACGDAPPASIASPSVPTASGVELDVYIDRSCSPGDDELRSTLEEVQRQLQVIVAENGITRLNYLTFAEDGFGARVAATVDMPTVAAEPADAKSEATAVFGNIREAEKRNAASRSAAQRDQRHVAIAAALARVTPSALLTDACNTDMPTCTDIAGVMERARMRGRHLSIVLTDFVDTCGKPPLQAALVTNPVVVLVLPSKSWPSTRRGLTTYTAALESSGLAGAVVGPWFAASDLQALVSQARNTGRRTRDPDRQRGS